MVNRIVHSRHDHLGAAACPDHVFIEQEAQPGGFERRHHGQRIVVPRHGVDGRVEMLQQGDCSCDRRFRRAGCQVAKVAGDDGEVVLQLIQLFCQCRPKTGIEVQVQIAEVENCRAIQRRWQVCQPHHPSHDAWVEELVVAMAMQSEQAETKTDERAAEHKFGGIGAGAGGKTAQRLQQGMLGAQAAAETLRAHTMFERCDGWVHRHVRARIRCPPRQLKHMVFHPKRG